MAAAASASVDGDGAGDAGAQRGQAAGGDLGAVEPGHRRARAWRPGRRAGASEAVRHAAAAGSTPTTARRACGAVARGGGGQRADADGHEDTSYGALRGGLGEQRGVAVDHPARGAGVADVGDLERRPAPPRRRGRARDRVLVVAVDHDDLGALAGDRLAARRQPSAPGGRRGSASPRRAATCATARPWLPGAGRDERVRVRAARAARARPPTTRRGP